MQSVTLTDIHTYIQTGLTKEMDTHLKTHTQIVNVYFNNVLIDIYLTSYLKGGVNFTLIMDI